MTDRFLESLGSGDFRSLLASAEPRDETMVSPDPASPPSDPASPSARSSAESRLQRRRLLEDAATWRRQEEMELADIEAEALALEAQQRIPPWRRANQSASAPAAASAVADATAAAAAAAAAAPAQASPESLEEEQARARALQLYRAAENSVRAAAAAAGSADPAAAQAYGQVESAFAAEHGIRWQDRGPRDQDAPDTWRGQRWRPGSQRYSSRGGDPGKNAFFAAQAAKARAKAKATGKGTTGKDKGKSKGQNKGKATTGKDKGKATTGKDKGKDTRFLTVVDAEVLSF